MTELSPQIDGLSIVLVGSFNPQIFQPAWFGSAELIRKQEAEAATIELIHPEVCTFRTDWFHLAVTRERFAISTVQQSAYEPMRDLVLETFKLLKHTPLTQMGINRDRHFTSRSKDEWHAIGHRLAPKEVWAPLLEKPGLLSLAIQGERTDGNRGRTVVKVEPSVQVVPGLYVNVNDHFDPPTDETQTTCEGLMGILAKSWSEIMVRAQSISSALAVLS